MPPGRMREAVLGPLRLVFALGAFAVVPPSAGAQVCSFGPSFLGPTDYAVGSAPRAVVAADFNRDGWPDIVSANSDGTISVRLADGVGGFGPSTSFAGGSGLTSIAAGEFNPSFVGTLDLAVTDEIAGTVKILLSDGTGGFTLTNEYTVGPKPRSVAVADFNRDGKADLATANFEDGTVSILLGSGGGAFVAAVPPTVMVGPPGSGFPVSVATGDFNRDGRPDFVAAVQGTGELGVALGNGDGTFVVSNVADAGMDALAVADFNRDGKLDVALAYQVPAQIVVRLGDGTGGFGSPVVNPRPWAALSLAAGDLDGDDIADLAVFHPSVAMATVLRGRGDGQFDSAPSLSTGAGPAGPAIGDFDRDGRPDLAVANSTDNDVSLFTNATGLPCPNASFGPAARSFGAGASPSSLARGDFNGDGALDVVVTNETAIPGTVSVLLAAPPGFGAYGNPTPFTVGSTPRHVAVGSFNSDVDAHLDLAVANFGSNSVSILLGDGSGGFGAASSLPTGGGQPTSVGIADLDADGRADLVVTHGMSDFVSIFLGNGDGTFDPPTTASVGSTGGSAVARGDFNRDGRQDLAVAVKTSSQVALLLGDGAGGFLGPATTYPVAASPGALVVGDFDRDGDADVATSGGSTVSVLFGDGTGGLLLPRDDYSVGSGADALAQGDFDADGWPDLATANVSAGTVSVLLGNGLGFGDFSPAVSLVSAGSPRGIIAASLDGDGYLDLATVNGSAQSLLVFSGDDNGGFGTAASYSTAPVTSGPVSVTVDDFNRDGIPDLAVPGSSNVAILLGTGSGGFFVPPGTAGAGTSPQHAAVGDFDGDGIPDLAVANLGSNDVSIRRGDGAGGFAPFSPSTDIGGIPSPRFVAAGDFDRDGKVDLVIAHGTNQVAVYGGDGSGGFAAGSPLTAGTTPVFIAVSDFDGNGEPDLAVANSASNDINVCFGGPGLTFSCGAPLGAGTKPVAIAVADFDRDGNPDLAVANENPGGTGSVSRFDNTDGMGTFSLLAPEVSVGTQPKGLVAADFDGDGLTDLALAGFGNRNTSVLLGNGDWTFDPTESWGVGGQPVWVAAGDFDRDGKPDLVTSSQNTSNVSAILNTNCRARRLGVLVDVDPLACPAPATTLTPPLVIRVLDDGGNRIRCDAGNVLASRMPAGPLGGTTTRPVVDGDATFSDLSVGDSGRFRVQFEHGPTADRARSRSFSQGVAVMISGPTELCEAAAAIYNAGPGYDKYTWVLDAPAPPLSVSQHARVSGLSPGPHTLDVQVKQDACTAVDSHLITVQANLSNVSVSPGGLQIVCTSCTGATLMENHLGGGTVTYQWAFRRETDSPPHVDIPGQTGPAYIVNGADFPGPGTYFVVVKTQSSLCGGPPVVSSNEVEVDVVVGPPADAVQFFTITSRSGQNFLEWKNPSGFGTVDIHRIEGTPSCAFPTDPNGPTLLTTKTGTLGQFDSFLDDFVSNDVTYCYTIFVVTDPGPPRQFSSGRSNRGRPFNTSLEVKWAFSIGTATLVPPGLGTEASDGVHAVANDNGLYSIAKGAAGGARPTSWTHVLLDGPSQGRPTTVLVPVPVGGGADRVIFLGSQGGTVHAINAANGGTPLWNAPVAPPLVQAGISGIFRSFPPGDFDYVFAATRVSGVDNQLHALNKDDGSPVGGNWPFDGGGAEGFIGLISGQPLVDYVSKRVYFTSFERNPAPSGDENTVWCVNIADATSCWPSVNRFYGNIAASPTMRGNRIYVGTLDGKVIALDATDGTFVWEYASGSGQAVRDFVFPDRLGRDLYFSTGNRVVALTEDVGQNGAAEKWPPITTINAPSAPTFLTGTTHLFLGDGDGKLHRLSTVDGTESAPFPITLGDGNATVGATTIDTRKGFIYAGTEAGIVYAVQNP